ncbi:hypothetical protein V8E36_009676 [Tilletia maclaganii]
MPQSPDLASSRSLASAASPSASRAIHPEHVSTTPDQISRHIPPKGIPARKRSHKDKAAASYQHWCELLPTLLEPYLSIATAFLPSPSSAVKLECGCSCTITREISIFALSSRGKLSVRSCDAHIGPLLVQNGAFPASPIAPRVAFSIELLRLFSALQLHSRLGALGFIRALNAFYAGGTSATKPDAIIDPGDYSRKQLAVASKWYHALLDHLHALTMRTPDTHAGPPLASLSRPPMASDDLHLTPLDLASRCPACFGGICAPRPAHIKSGPAVIVCIDGNFQHKRRRRPDAISTASSAPSYFLSESQLQTARQDYERSATSNGPKTGCSSEVRAAIDGCIKASKGGFDVVGIMGLTCRHGAPLLFADIRDTGEAHFYAYALIYHIVKGAHGRLPSLGVCYDIGCKLAASPRMKQCIKALGVQVEFAVSLFHVYGHGLDCQLKFSPRRVPGFAMTDGESLERLWSALSGLIPITRSMTLVGRGSALSNHLSHLTDQHQRQVGHVLQQRKLHFVNTQPALEAQIRDALPIIAALPVPSTDPTATPGPEAPPNLSADLRVAVKHLVASSTARRQAAFNRPALTNRRKDRAPLPTASFALYVALSQLRALESYVRRGLATGSQKTNERLMMAKASTLSRARRARTRFNLAIEKVLALPDTPTQPVLVPIQDDKDLLSLATLTRVTAYVDFFELSKQPWYQFPLFVDALDAFEVLLRHEEEFARIRVEQSNLVTWAHHAKRQFLCTEDDFNSVGWSDFIAFKVSRVDALRAWWKTDAPSKNRPVKKAAAAQDIPATATIVPVTANRRSVEVDPSDDDGSDLDGSLSASQSEGAASESSFELNDKEFSEQWLPFDDDSLPLS